MACSDPEPAPTSPAPAIVQPPVVHPDDPSTGLDSTLEFGDAVLGELVGDSAGARASYERLLAQQDVPAIAARSMLHLAQLESAAGNARNALQLAGRAKALAPNDTGLLESIQRLQAEVVAAAGAGEIRGPRPGTALAVAPDVAAQFAHAEAQLERVHKQHIFVSMLGVMDSIEDGRAPFLALINEYLRVAEHGGVAAVAAHYRAASVAYDLAIEFAEARPPGELLPERAADVQNTLAALETDSLAIAQREYKACLASPQSPDSELWRVAAEADLRVLDIQRVRTRR